MNIPDGAGAPALERQRPTAPQWLGYAFGKGLPAANRDWVLHDTTCGTWYLRHLARAFVQLAIPIVAVCVLLPGPAWIRVVTVVASTALGLIFSLAFMVETTEHRLAKAGYPVGLGERTRQQHAVQAQHESSARRRERIAARTAVR
jgi:Family of unknown function (DUF5313)